MKLPIKVVAGAACDCVVGMMGNTLRVRVKAPAERGKANAAVEKLIANALGIPKGCAAIVAGKTSARKIMQIEGLSESEVYRKLSYSVDPRCR